MIYKAIKHSVVTSRAMKQVCKRTGYELSNYDLPILFMLHNIFKKNGYFTCSSLVPGLALLHRDNQTPNIRKRLIYYNTIGLTDLSSKHKAYKKGSYYIITSKMVELLNLIEKRIRVVRWDY